MSSDASLLERLRGVLALSYTDYVIIEHIVQYAGAKTQLFSEHTAAVAESCNGDRQHDANLAENTADGNDGNEERDVNWEMAQRILLTVQHGGGSVVANDAVRRLVDALDIGAIVQLIRATMELHDDCGAKLDLTRALKARCPEILHHLDAVLSDEEKTTLQAEDEEEEDEPELRRLFGDGWRSASEKDVADLIVKLLRREVVTIESDGRTLAAKLDDSLATDLDWNQVVRHLDRADFRVPDRASLSFLVALLNESFSRRNLPFPVAFLYSRWNNVDAQWSWLSRVVEHSDILCLGHQTCRKVDISALKVPPEHENLDVASWMALDLTETILRIGVAIEAYQKHVATLCPDLFALAGLQLDLEDVGDDSRSALVAAGTRLICVGSPNAGSILSFGWGADDSLKRSLVVEMLARSSIDADGNRWTKILELTHDLKPDGLVEVLRSKWLHFTVPLACLAARRGFLKLDKWLDDRVRECGDEVVVRELAKIMMRPDQVQMMVVEQRNLIVGLIGRFTVNEQFAHQSFHQSPSTSSLLPAGSSLSPSTSFSTPVHPSVSKTLPTGFGGLGASGAGNAGGGGPPGQAPPFGRESLLGPLRSAAGSAPGGGGNPIGIGGIGSGGSSSSLFGTPPPFGSSNPLSASPGASMMRTQFGAPGGRAGSAGGGGGPPPTQSSASSGGGIWPGSVRAGGAATPNMQLDALFRGPPGPGGLLPDFGGAMLGRGLPPQPPQQNPPPMGAPPPPQPPPTSVAPAPITDDLTQMNFSEEIQHEANSYFEHIYSNDSPMSVNDLITRLKQFRSSHNPHHQMVLACVVKNLFEEYRFFHDYPERELRTTAEVYGGIIREGIIANLHFATAVRKVIESLQADVGSMLWTFGIVALNACRTKLSQYPRVCAMIAAHENFSKFPTELRDFVTAGQQGQLPVGYVAPTPTSGGPQGPSGQLAGRDTPTMGLAASWQAVAARLPQDAARTAAVETSAAAISANTVPNRGGTSVLSVTNVDTLVQATERSGGQVEAPEASIVERVAFIFNNVSGTNLTQKAEEMSQSVLTGADDKLLRWLAQYLVMRRVSVEQNFQPLYASFLSTLNNPKLDAFVKQETFRNIRILLRSDKRQAASNYSDRQLLKNLGMWLGTMTIARSVPIVANELDLKSLLLEAYYKGQQELLFVVPFVAKVVQACNKSPIFGPSSSWIRAILKVLAELHNEPDLKINLKFEIEVLCKELQVDLNSLPIEGVLKDTERLVRVPQQLGDVRMLMRPDATLGGSLSSMLPGGAAQQTGTSPLLISASSLPGIASSAQAQTASVQAAQALVERAAAALGTRSVSPAVAGSGVGGASSAAAAAGDDGTGAAEVAPAAAHYAYHDINVVSVDGIAQYLKISATLPLFQMHPQMKHVVRPAIFHAIRELVGAVSDRALKVAMNVTEHIVRKDFALSGDEVAMRRAAQHMMRAMTAGMAAITCRDPLTSNMLGYLSQAFSNSLRGVTPEQQKMIEEAALAITTDNVELTTNFVVKTACEKAAPELDKRLEPEYTARASARAAGRSWPEPGSAGWQQMQTQQQHLPEQLRVTTNTPGALTSSMMAIYEQFSRRICGFKPTTAEDMLLDSAAAQPIPGTDKDMETFVASLKRIVAEIDASLRVPATQNKAFLAVTCIRDAVVQLSTMPRDGLQLHTLVQRSVEQILYAYINIQPGVPSDEWQRRLRDTFLTVCRVLLNHLALHELTKKITRAVLDCRAEHRYNADAAELLLRHQLLAPAEYDRYLVQLMDGGSNYEATMYAQRLIKSLGVQETMRFLPSLWDQIHKMHQYGGRLPAGLRASPAPTPSSGLGGLAAVAAAAAAAAEGSATAGVVPGGGAQAGQSDDATAVPAAASRSDTASAAAPASLEDQAESQRLQNKVEIILREWIQLCYTPVAQREPQQALATIVHMMHEQGVLATDEQITRFFRLCTEMCVDVAYSSLIYRSSKFRLLRSEQSLSTTVVRQRCYYTLDAFVQLTCLMVKHSDGTQYQTKINLLKKVLNIVTTVLAMDHEMRRLEFHPMPYHRILIVMFNELTLPDPALEPIAWNILEAFGQALFILQPRRVPGFAYAWLDIVGHRNVMTRILSDSNEPLKAAAMYTQLLICHLKFLAPFLRNLHMTRSVAVMYKGTLRVLLVILHDFPELLCEYHYVLCDTIPPNCIQLRNLVLSAYPRPMRLPDPFALAFRDIDMIPDMAMDPRMHVQMSVMIPPDLRNQLNAYLDNRQNIDFISELPTMLQSGPNNRLNLTTLNALVVHVGVKAIESLRAKNQKISITTVAHTAHMDVLQNLAVRLCTEGRYLLFNAIANQLRYPNTHTHYFSCTFLWLFQQSTGHIQEQITRILFERLVALRPHPWGLLITFIELIKNPAYSFWQNDFTRCAPEIERLFQNVANTCVLSMRQHKDQVAA